MSLNFRLVGLLVITIVAAYYSYGYYSLSMSINNVVKIDGVINIWGAYATFIVALFATINVVIERFSLTCLKVQGNVIAVVSILIISPFFTYITYKDIQFNIQGYVECKEHREFWSRYSSRTYAKTQELCLTIK